MAIVGEQGDHGVLVIRLANEFADAIGEGELRVPAVDGARVEELDELRSHAERLLERHVHVVAAPVVDAVRTAAAQPVARCVVRWPEERPVAGHVATHVDEVHVEQ